MKTSPVVFLILGIILIWTGLNGTLGTFLASIFTPSQVKLSDGEEES